MKIKVLDLIDNKIKEVYAIHLKDGIPYEIWLDESMDQRFNTDTQTEFEILIEGQSGDNEGKG